MDQGLQLALADVAAHHQPCHLVLRPWIDIDMKLEFHSTHC
jgi:hypothetical protein